MAFQAYTHLERLGKQDVEGILNGVCEIQPKVDGTNSCVWCENEEIHTGSRKREIKTDDDNASFAYWMSLLEEDEPVKLRTFLYANPDITIYGEWMGLNKFVGCIKDYDDTAKSHLWIFDMYDRAEGRYLSGDEWRPMAEQYNLTEYCVPVIAKLENPTEDELLELAKDNKFLLNNANHAGEGIVIKNYDYINIYGRFTMAKIVLEEFTQSKKQSKKVNLAAGEVEQNIVDMWVTDAELAKAKAKVCVVCNVDEFDTKSGKMIGMYMNEVFNGAVIEEMGDIIKKLKMPTINFGELRRLTQNKARKYLGLI